jgi:hypothetical protein
MIENILSIGSSFSWSDGEIKPNFARWQAEGKRRIFFEYARRLKPTPIDRIAATDLRLHILIKNRTILYLRQPPFGN